MQYIYVYDRCYLHADVYLYWHLYIHLYMIIYASDMVALVDDCCKGCCWLPHHPWMMRYEHTLAGTSSGKHRRYEGAFLLGHGVWGKIVCMFVVTVNDECDWVKLPLDLRTPKHSEWHQFAFGHVLFWIQYCNDPDMIFAETYLYIQTLLKFTSTSVDLTRKWHRTLGTLGFRHLSNLPTSLT